MWCTLWDICSQLSQTEFTDNLSKKCKFFLEFKFDSIVFSNQLLVTFCDSTSLNESYIIRQYDNLVITVLSRAIHTRSASFYLSTNHRWTKWLKRKGMIYVSNRTEIFSALDCPTSVQICFCINYILSSWDFC